MDLIALLSRWTHITSMAFLIGGAIYARFIVGPALDRLGPAEKAGVHDRIAAILRPIILGAIAALILSGLYNLLHKKSIPAGYHMVFGIKMLLALHIIAVGVLLGRTGVDPAKRDRWTFGIVITGLIILMLSAYLRSLA